VPRDVVSSWIKYLRNEFPTIAFKSSTQAQDMHLKQSATAVEHASQKQLLSSDCLGADSLVGLLKNYCRNAKIKTTISVGVIGFPNVGKSSVINSLKRSKACSVGNTPGMTKSMQEISLDRNIKLLDCPGIVFSQGKSETDADNALRNCVKVEMLEDPITPVEAVIKRCKAEQLVKIYNVPPFINVHDFLAHLARQRGKLRKVGHKW
jgi:nuclear GTP-binding protein